MSTTRDIPLISVIIPTYNRAKLLERSIGSVLKQTFHDFELIIVDDASTDETEAVVSKYMQEDSRIKYLKQQINAGGSIARNAGIEMAKGQYIAFQDSDDEWLPNKLQLQIEAFNMNPQADIVYTGIYFCEEGSSRHILGKRISEVSGNNILPKLLQKEVIPATPAIMVKKSCLNKVGGFSDAPANQDYLLYLKLAYRGYYFQPVPEPLVYVFEQEGGITTNFDKKIKGRLKVIKYIHKLMLERSLKRQSLASQFFRLGTYYLLNDNYHKAKRAFIKSMLNKFTIKSLIFMVGTYFLGNSFRILYIESRRLFSEPINYSVNQFSSKKDRSIL